jgi:hypothetical protein
MAASNMSDNRAFPRRLLGLVTRFVTAKKCVTIDIAEPSTKATIAPLDSLKHRNILVETTHALAVDLKRALSMEMEKNS